jgi:ribosome-binding protein aMBF1 (putative translation factor)
LNHAHGGCARKKNDVLALQLWTVHRFAVSPQEKIAKLEAELKQAKRDARTTREPVSGIGGAIQRARMKAGMSLGELGDACNTGKGNLSRIETTPDANPTLQTMVRISRAMKISLFQLLLDGGIQ